MLFPAIAGSGVSLLVICRSTPLNTVVCVAVLFVVFASGVNALFNVAVFVICDPIVAVGDVATVTINCPDPPDGYGSNVHVIAPVPPTAGVVHAAGVPIWLIDTNV